jgi:hypothetical protein
VILSPIQEVILSKCLESVDVGLIILEMFYPQLLVYDRGSHALDQVCTITFEVRLNPERVGTILAHSKFSA